MRKNACFGGILPASMVMQRPIAFDWQNKRIHFTMADLVLASQSAVRATLLKNAGLTFSQESAQIDERATEAPLIETGFNPSDIAEVLAEAKAMDVSHRYPAAYVIGADQTMSYSHDGAIVRAHKPKNMEEARGQLLQLRGKTHTLHAALCCVKGGETLFRYTDNAHLTMRNYSPAFIGQYLSSTGEKALTSVGCYQLEGEGIQLFEEVNGNYFTILGLPLLPLLDFLRSQGILGE